MLERLDLGERLSFVDIHDREMMATHFPGVPYAKALAEMQVRTPGGVITSGYFAFRTLTRVLPALRPVRYGLYLPGVVQIGQIVYRWVAQNRYRLVDCETEICNLHVRALSQANIDEVEIAAIVESARQAAQEASV
jgi:predicted DCC family thiol-disulfide oxidoreductase YuxK